MYTLRHYCHSFTIIIVVFIITMMIIMTSSSTAVIITAIVTVTCRCGILGNQAVSPSDAGRSELRRARCEAEEAIEVRVWAR